MAQDTAGQFKTGRKQEAKGVSAEPDTIPRDFEASAASRADILRAAAWIEERVLAHLSDSQAPPGLLRQISDSFIRLQGDVSRLELRLVEAEEAQAARMEQGLHAARRFRQTVVALLLVIAALLSALLLQPRGLVSAEPGAAQAQRP